MFSNIFVGSTGGDGIKFDLKGCKATLFCYICFMSNYQDLPAIMKAFSGGQCCTNIFFNVGPPQEDICFDHLLWSIFQSIVHIHHTSVDKARQTRPTSHASSLPLQYGLLHCSGTLMGPSHKLTYLSVHQSLFTDPLSQPVSTPVSYKVVSRLD